MQSKTVYKRNVDGSIQEWTIQVDGNKYRSVYGKLDGLKVTSEWVECFSKNVGRRNETTPEEQAIFDAESKLRAKIDKEHYFQDIGEIDRLLFIKPMLAKSYDDHKKKIKFPAYSDMKIDGGRGIFSFLGLQSRTGQDILSTPHIIEALYPILEKYPDLVLDGELYNHSLRDNLNRIMSLIRNTVNLTEECLKESKKIIEFWVFDGWGFNGITQETPFEERKRALHELLDGYNKHITVVKTKKVDSFEELDLHYLRLVEFGFEGQIIRYGNCKYENKRSDKILKRKDFKDEEFMVVGFEDGLGKAKDLAYVAVLMTKDGKEFRAGLNFSEEECKEIWDNKEDYKGKYANVRFLKYSEYGIPLIPKVKCFRDL